MENSHINVYLVGFMGTGKSTVGKRLAKVMGYQFIDSDEYIEKKENKTIEQIFAENGEAFFRSLERDFVVSGHPKEGCVVSCGGGLITQEGMIGILKKRGLVIALVASATVIYERVKNHSHRPLLRGEDPLGIIKKLLAERNQYYAKIPNQIITDSRSLPDIVGQIKRLIK